MKFIFSVVFTILLFSYPLIAQDKKALQYASSISAEELKNHLSILSADSLEGRETGERGQKMAAQYLAQQFEKMGLNPPVSDQGTQTNFQMYPLNRVKYNQVYLRNEQDTLRNLRDFLYFSRDNTSAEDTIDIVFVGDIENLEIEGLEIQDKFIAFTASEMLGWRSKLNEIENVNVQGYVILLEDNQQLQFAIDRFGKILTKSKLGFEKEPVGTKTILGGTSLVNWLFGTPFEELKASDPGQVSQIILNADIRHDELMAENVLGYLEGSEIPDELVIITAHYDHVGIIDGLIYNGADDDGSGTSTLLEIAEAFSIANQAGDTPRRSMLFMAVSGEEKGLLGSEYYTSHPVFPLENTVANLNIDMVGRIDHKHKDNPYYVYLIGSDKLSQDLHQLSEKVNKKYTQLDFDYTYNSDNDPNRFYYRSDHYNFAKNNIPIIFYFNGTHEDYHRPTDTIEKIHFDKMKKIADLVFFTAWEIANREKRIELD